MTLKTSVNNSGSGFDKFIAITDIDTIIISDYETSRLGSTALYYWGERDIILLDLSDQFSSISNILPIENVANENTSYYSYKYGYLFSSLSASRDSSGSMVINDNPDTHSNDYFLIDGTRLIWHMSSSATFQTSSGTLGVSETLYLHDFTNVGFMVYGYA